MTSELAQTNSSYTPQMLMPVARPNEAIEAHKAAVSFIQEALESGKDFGKIPGTDDKMNLLKPGAERLAGGYGLRPTYDIAQVEVDHERENTFELTKWVKRQKPDRATETAMKEAKTGRNKKVGDGWVWQESETEHGKSFGLYRYVIICKLWRGETQVGEGIGSCSSMETKYIRSPRDYENTVIKMAKKRAFVDAILTTLGLSDRFTQDAEDVQGNKAVVDDTVPMVEAELVEEPKQDVSMDRAKEAGAWLKSLGVTAEDLKQIKAHCGDQTWFDAVWEYKVKGFESAVVLMAAFTPAEPVQAELVDDAPKKGTSK